MDDDREESLKLEIRRLYYVIIADYREGKRAEAAKALAGMGDEERRLADAAVSISQAIYGNGGEQSISKGMDGLEGFPETSFWALFKEVAGQALMERALHGSAPEETRGMLFSKGLMLASRASGPGFPLMGETTALVSEGKSKFPESASMADKLLMKGDDRKSFRKTGEDPPPKKAARKRA